ncbi:MAG: antibiotic biosynthesis monooxygenase [Pirellulaceae bacterium]|nr:antibiotic biosynthesis monooxygenase [Pirellulaceae bacterium]
MIYVIATIEVVPGKRQDFLREFHRIVPLVQAEQGCLMYEPTEDVETNIAAQGPVRENVVTIVEKWSSMEELEAHLIAPHMLEYRTRVKSLVASVGLQILQPAAAP